MSEKTATDWKVLRRAHEALWIAVAAVPAQAWDRSTPCDQWTVAQVLQHAVGDQLAYASAITGTPGPTENPFAPSGMLGQEPLDLLEPALVAARSAWAGVAEGGQAPTPLPQGDLPAPVGAGACALDAAVHAWDIAVAIGQPAFLPSELAERLLAAAQAVVEPLRAYGAYAEALAPRPDDDGAAELLRYLGRNPRWSGARWGEPDDVSSTTR